MLSQNRAVLARLILLFVFIALLGLAPRPHQETESMMQARQAQEKGDPAGASRDLAMAAAQNPWRADLWEQVGTLALQAGDHQAARHYLEYAGEVHTALGSQMSAQSRLDLGDACLGTDDLPAAIQAWDQSIAAGAPSDQAGWRVIQAQRVLGLYPEARERLSDLTGNYPDNAQINYEYGLISAALDPQAALEPLSRAAELDPTLEKNVEILRRSILSARISEEPAYALVSAGQALAALDHWDLAAEAFYQAALQFPDYADAWAFLGGARQMLQYAGGSLSQAPSAQGDGWTEIQTALELDPLSLSALNFAVIYWLNQGREDLALGYAQNAAQEKPDEPDLQVQLGNLLAANGDLDGADAAFQQAAELAPFEPAPLHARIDFSLKYGYQVSQVALPAARQAVTIAPQDPITLDLMAQVLIQLGDLPTARRFVMQALEQNPNFASAHIHLGVIYLLEGQEEAGYQELTLAESLVDEEGPLASQIERLLASFFTKEP